MEVQSKIEQYRNLLLLKKVSTYEINQGLDSEKHKLLQDMAIEYVMEFKSRYVPEGVPWNMKDVQAKFDEDLKVLYETLEDAEKFTLMMSNETPEDVKNWKPIK